MLKYEYDIIVVGAGHAGCEAATVAATMGAKTLLLTIDMNNIAQLSCNPAMGGIAKGQIVREIDALGGRTARITDASSIQFRMLNRSKGPAMWSPRAQLDRQVFVQNWINELHQQENLDIRQDIVLALIIKEGRVEGVVTSLWGEIYAPRVVLTVGTFLNGLMHFGELKIAGGRISEKASYGITEQLISLGISAGRMKTGTPARVVGRSVDFSLTDEQPSDEGFSAFSFLTDRPNSLKQRNCHILYTNEACHQVLHESMAEAPIFNGQIESIGPRYCPSIEAKVVTFRERNRHQLFLEPETQYGDEFYLNGFSSSLPLAVQLKALRKIPALREVKLFRPGYAIEYDFFDPTQLYPTLQSMVLPNLFLAGQINGTTGYEEAAGQGLIAGINAVLSLQGKSHDFVLARDEAYIGVLIDDLVTRGVDEPYRMFTSRAEFRTLLRHDIADERLTPKAISLGIASSVRTDQFQAKQEAKSSLEAFIRGTSVSPETINSYLVSVGEKPLKQGVKLRDVVVRSNVSLGELIPLVPGFNEFLSRKGTRIQELLSTVEVKIKYEGYIKREQLDAARVKRLEEVKLGDRFDYTTIDNISIEAREKLQKIKPVTIGQASRIPGVSPHDVSVLLLMASKPSEISRETN